MHILPTCSVVPVPPSILHTCPFRVCVPAPQPLNKGCGAHLGAVGRAVDGAQGTFFFGDHIDNQTGLVQTDWYTFSGQLKPNNTLFGYDIGNKEFNFFLCGPNAL